MKRVLFIALLSLTASCSARMRGSEAGPVTDPPSRPEATASPAPERKEVKAPTKAADAKEKGETIIARHVLIQYMGSDRAGKSVVRTKDQARTLAEEVARRARAGEDLGRLAVDYSDEPGASSRGGSLGRFGHGQMVKAFEDVAFSLKPGEISEVVETGFGYHVIQRIE